MVPENPRALFLSQNTLSPHLATSTTIFDVQGFDSCLCHFILSLRSPYFAGTLITMHNLLLMGCSLLLIADYCKTDY